MLQILLYNLLIKVISNLKKYHHWWFLIGEDYILVVLVFFCFIWQNFYLDCTDRWFPNERRVGPKRQIKSNSLSVYQFNSRLTVDSLLNIFAIFYIHLLLTCSPALKCLESFILKCIIQKSSSSFSFMDHYIFHL